VRQLTERRDEVAAERDSLRIDVAAQLTVIAEERGRATEERSSIADSMPADLLGLYDKIRADHAGVGAAPLYRGRCEGCRMQLPPTEIEALRAAAPDAVVRCEDCRRILVRTPESGL
jgi:predicted  nucleic acid-binding Zn-ribbon protein